MIDAANRIRHRPYRWGGGHRDWGSRGYDCSGSVSYVMHAPGLLESTGFMRWGGGGMHDRQAVQAASAILVPEYKGIFEPSVLGSLLALQVGVDR
jgi:hypothetical protein